MNKFSQLSKKVKIIIIVAICIVVCAIIGALMPNDKDDNNPKATNTHILSTTATADGNTASPTAIVTPEPDLTASPTIQTTVSTATPKIEQTPQPTKTKISVTLNTSTKVFHVNNGCHNAENIKEENKEVVEVDDIQEVKDMGYKACGTCSKAYKD